MNYLMIGANKVKNRIVEGIRKFWSDESGMGTVEVILKNDTIINPKLNKNHIFKGTIIESTNANKVKTEVELVKLASELISLNTDKTLGWHVQKFDE